MPLPLIGITSPHYPRENQDPLVGVAYPYVEAVTAAGGIPLVLPELIARLGSESIQQIASMLDGVVFSGGEDIDPAVYNEAAHPKLGAVDKDRDLFELELLRQAFKINLPTLAICRGIQVMNVALGGSLYQDIGSQLTTTIEHRNGSGKVERRQIHHDISIEKDSLLNRVLQCSTLPANSIHHQSVKDVAPQLKVSARAADGVIEGIEDRTKSFFIGVQCHPEVLWNENGPQWKNLWIEFVRASAQFNAQKR